MNGPAKNFDGLLKDNQAKFEQSLTEMTRKQERILSLASQALGQWFPEYAGEAVSSNTYVSSQLDDERLGAMKREVLSLANSANEIVKKHFSSKTWWHEDYLKTKKEPMLQPQTDRFEAALRDARCELGRVLANYGFIQGDDIERESFIRFANVPVPGNVSSAFREYMLEALKARSLIHERLRLESEKMSVGAKTRWESL